MYKISLPEYVGSPGLHIELLPGELQQQRVCRPPLTRHLCKHRVPIHLSSEQLESHSSLLLELGLEAARRRLGDGLIDGGGEALPEEPHGEHHGHEGEQHEPHHQPDPAAAGAAGAELPHTLGLLLQLRQVTAGR